MLGSWRPLKRFPLSTRFFIFLALMLTGIYFIFIRLMTNALPPERMALFPNGSLSPAFILRDRNGVPYIVARTDEDAYFAIGYAHAQDRLWQLEMQRRMIDGEMSELSGRSALRQDMLFKSLNLRSAAESAWPALSDKAKLSLRRYVEGINARIDSTAALPIEFKLFGIQPRHWTPLDSLARLKLFALSLSGDFQSDLVREMARGTLTTEQLHALFFEDRVKGLTEAEAAQTGLAASGATILRARAEAPPWAGWKAAGVTAWAVSGHFSAQGAALIASDSYGDLQIPSPWYALRARGDKLSIAGMTLVGTPLVIFGRNDRIAWGGANLMADTEDVYFENADPSDASRYERQGQWVKFETHNETIKIGSDIGSSLIGRNYSAVRVQLRATNNGPVISDQFNGFDRPFTLRWVGFDPADTSYESFYRLQYASDWLSFRDALRVHITPALNMIYADIDGNIGSVAAGKIPVRERGTGALPAPGWDDTFTWKRFMQFNELPSVYNPPAGFIVGIGQVAGSQEVSSICEQNCVSIARTERIKQLLQERTDVGARLTLADMKHFQGDVIDLDSAKLVSKLTTHATVELQRQALALLVGWNGSMSVDSQAAAIYSVWARHLAEFLVEDKLHFHWNKPEQDFYLRSLEQQMDARALTNALYQCDRPSKPAGNSATETFCQNMLSSTLSAALDEVTRMSGSPNIPNWRWGALQHGTFVHEPFSTSGPLNLMFERESSQGGSANTINLAMSTFVDHAGFAQSIGTTFRQVISMGTDHAEHDFMNSTGQSGDVASPHYADMIKPFSELKYYPMWFDDKSVPPRLRDGPPANDIHRIQ